VEREAHQSKAEALAAVHGSDEEHGADAMMLALAAAQAWGGTAPAIRNPLDAPETERRARHRAALLAAVAAMVDALLPAAERADAAHA
jgi:hypothetical protein